MNSLDRARRSRGDATTEFSQTSFRVTRARARARALMNHVLVCVARYRFNARGSHARRERSIRLHNHSSVIRDDRCVGPRDRLRFISHCVIPSLPHRTRARNLIASVKRTFCAVARLAFPFAFLSCFRWAGALPLPRLRRKFARRKVH